ncbi:hypothetical protein ZWY2020_022549 [Hordeum vulgare]|nr:hypothetical protein ZWY2020_022549 [Hordeum vulgare]
MPPLARWFAGSRGDAINGDPVVRAQSRRFPRPSPLARWFDGSRGDVYSLWRIYAGQLPRRLPSHRCAIYTRRPAARRHTRRSPALLLSPALRRPAAGLRRPDVLFLPPPFSDVPAIDHAGGSSSGGGTPESNWPQSLDKPLTQELYNFGLLVPPGCRLAKPWRICKDGYPTLDNPATPEQLRVHPGGCYNTRRRHAYWDGKNYNDVITRYRQEAAAGDADSIPRRRRAAIPHPPPTTPVVAPAVSTEYEVPPEQFVLREDGDPDDSPGLLVAMRASQATTAAAAAREEAEIATAI